MKKLLMVVLLSATVHSASPMNPSIIKTTMDFLMEMAPEIGAAGGSLLMLNNSRTDNNIVEPPTELTGTDTQGNVTTVSGVLQGELADRFHDSARVATDRINYERKSGNCSLI